MYKFRIIFTFYLFIGNIFFVYTQNIKTQKIDTLTDKFDIKVTKKHKILPIVLPVTEPAVGVGLIGGVIYFMSKNNPEEKSDIIGGAGGITTNGTWFAGGGYLGFWNDDKIRYTGASGYGEITLDYYGLGSENPITFDQNMFFFSQQMNFRIGESDFFLGGKYSLSKITIPQEINEPTEIDPEDFEFWNSGVSMISEYDNLNNFLSPTKGLKFHLSYTQNLELLGSNRDWGKLDFYSHLYFQVNEKWISAFRVESSVSTGKPPFYAYPYVYMRGIPALRYQGKISMLGETEQTYNVSPRWGIVGFTGIGAAFKSVEDVDVNNLVWNAGAGVRYLVLKDMGLKIGADAARGPEDWAFYVIIGSAWGM